MPSNDWQFVEGGNGVDVSSPTGDAVASFAYATNAPGPSTPAQLRQMLLTAMGATDVRIINQGAPFDFGGAQRQTTELTATRNGATIHVLLTVDAFNNPANGYGIDAYLEYANANVWAQDQATLHLILAHMTFQGRPSNVPPGG